MVSGNITHCIKTKFTVELYKKVNIWEIKNLCMYSSFLEWYLNRQIWLTMFISLLPNSQLRIVQMVRYYCFGLQKRTTEQK